MKQSTNVLEEVMVSGYEVHQQPNATVSAPHKQPKVGRAIDIRTRQVLGNSVIKEKAEDASWRNNNDFEREGYDAIKENRFLRTMDNPLSTFSIDVDAASYSNIRRMLNAGNLPLPEQCG